MEDIKVNILGCNYNIEFRNENTDELLENFDGYCDSSVNLIRIKKIENCKDSLKNLDEYKNKVLRHELIHAFLDQSGLMGNSEWARNEEMIDFFAIQFHKIEKVFKEANC